MGPKRRSSAVSNVAPAKRSRATTIASDLNERPSLNLSRFKATSSNTSSSATSSFLAGHLGFGSDEVKPPLNDLSKNQCQGSTGAKATKNIKDGRPQCTISNSYSEFHQEVGGQPKLKLAAFRAPATSVARQASNKAEGSFEAFYVTKPGTAQLDQKEQDSDLVPATPVLSASEEDQYFFKAAQDRTKSKLNTFRYHSSEPTTAGYLEDDIARPIRTVEPVGTFANYAKPTDDINFNEAFFNVETLPGSDGAYFEEALVARRNENLPHASSFVLGDAVPSFDKAFIQDLLKADYNDAASCEAIFSEAPLVTTTAQIHDVMFGDLYTMEEVHETSGYGSEMAPDVDDMDFDGEIDEEALLSTLPEVLSTELLSEPTTRSHLPVEFEGVSVARSTPHSEQQKIDTAFDESWLLVDLNGEDLIELMNPPARAGNANGDSREEQDAEKDRNSESADSEASSERHQKMPPSPLQLADLVSSTLDLGVKPIVRSPFPARSRDRSPVAGLTSDTVLRTCFRVGEALNTGCDAARRSEHVIIELYARVRSSSRCENGDKQYFKFGDLFHDRGPFLEGTYEGWKGVNPWEYDSSVFLGAREGEEKLCRAVGRIVRGPVGWKMTVLNIWEAGWEDVEHVRGIVCS